MLGARLSLRVELAAEREVLMVSSSAGMVLVSSRQGTVPFSFSSSICRGATRPRVRRIPSPRGWDSKIQVK